MTLTTPSYNHFLLYPSHITKYVNRADAISIIDINIINPSTFYDLKDERIYVLVLQLLIQLMNQIHIYQLVLYM